MIWMVVSMGLIIGSFLNVCIYRIPKGESVSFPPSHCPVCNHKIKWYENIPVFSYFILLRGRCSSCKNKISLQYPLVEILTGVLFYIFYLKFGYTLITLKYLVFTVLLIVGTGVDLEHHFIPDRITISILVVGLITSFFTIGFESSVLGAGSFALFYIILYGYGESTGYEIMGFGDVKLAMGIGAMVGFVDLYTVYMFINIAFITGAVVGVTLLVLKLKTRKDMVAFGPYISLAGLVIAYIS